MKPGELLERGAHGDVVNVGFGDFQRLIEALGFRLVRRKGAHHVYVHSAVLELVNVQPRRGQAKPYQIRQVVELALRYSLTVEKSR